MTDKDGGPAFPIGSGDMRDPTGMSLRDWFAGQLQADDRLVKVVRAMDDEALAIFAVHPYAEDEEAIAYATDYNGLSQVQAVEKRLLLESKAIARVRYMQADAMLSERDTEARQ